MRVLRPFCFKIHSIFLGKHNIMGKGIVVSDVACAARLGIVPAEFVKWIDKQPKHLASFIEECLLEGTKEEIETAKYLFSKLK